MRERQVAYSDPRLRGLKKKSQEKKRFFLHRELSLEWVRRLFGLGRSAIVVGLMVRFRAFLRRSDRCVLTTRGLKDYGVSRQRKWAALRQLEGNGLVEVLSARGKNPTVVVLDPPRNEFSQAGGGQ